jgi:DNA-binding response OmpR family regulator
MRVPAPQFDERRDTDRALRIVVVDDDRDTVDMLSIILRDEGHVVHGFYAAKDVLPAVRVLRPDVMIIDIAIPGMSGYALAQAIRHSFPDVRRPLLIAISGQWNDAPDRMIGAQMGFDHHLAKPCDPADVVRTIEAFARTRNGA